MPAGLSSADGNSLKAQTRFSLMLPPKGQRSLQESPEPHLCCHPLQPAMCEWKTQIPARSSASTISGPRSLPKASLDLASSSTTWERLFHKPAPSSQETRGRKWTADSLGDALCLGLCHLREGRDHKVGVPRSKVMRSTS